MPAPVEVSGLAPLLQVFDMPTSIAFYCDVLGGEIVAQSQPGPRFDWALLRLGGAELMLNTAYEDDARPPAPDPARRAAHADTGLYLGCRDLDTLHAHLRARGLAVPAPIVRPYGMRQLSVEDPDGYLLAFQHPAG